MLSGFLAAIRIDGVREHLRRKTDPSEFDLHERVMKHGRHQRWVPGAEHCFSGSGKPQVSADLTSAGFAGRARETEVMTKKWGVTGRERVAGHQLVARLNEMITRRGRDSKQ